MSKTICIYHSIDLDGWMSAAIVKKWFAENNKNHSITMLGWNYGNKIPDLEEYNKVIMCDISFPKDVMLKINKKLGKNFIWIDHHQSTIDEINSLIKEKGVPMEGLITILGEKYAACELSWEYFFPNNKMPEIVRLLGMYDSFRHKGTDEEQKVLEFQYGARTVMSNYEDCYLNLQNSLNYNSNIEFTTPEEDILIQGKGIYKYLKQEAKQIYDKAFEIILNERCNQQDDRNYYKFLCVNQERFNPVNFGIDYHKDGYDGFACFSYNKGKWNFSLYNDNGNIDCSLIAKQYGGGGHKGAAGFVCDNKTMLKIINN